MLKATPQIIWLSTALYSASRDPGVCFSACVSVFKHICMSLSAAGSPFREFPTGQDSLTSPRQSAFNDAAKNARLQKKKIPQRVFAVHSGSITFRIFFFKCMVCTVNMISEESPTVFDDVRESPKVKGARI